MVYSLVESPNFSLILGWMASSFFYFSFIFTLDSSSLSKTDTTTFAKLNKPPLLSNDPFVSINLPLQTCLK